LRIAVADPLPAFRRGLMEILRDAGFESETPDDLVAWARDQQVKVVVISVLSEADWNLLDALHRAAVDLLSVALLEQTSVAASVRALRAGAVCVIARDASQSVLRERLRAVVRGESLVPVEVLRALAASSPVSPPLDEPSPDEREWLHKLASGMTVSRLAAEARYSERMMFRLLRDLYTRLGAGNRTDALIKAQQKGWL
jgi:DNA-binding NarL/FixJ family response regulator